MDDSATKLCTNPDHAGPNPLPTSEFYKDSGSTTGLSSRCKVCVRAGARRKYREADPEKQREKSRQWRAANPEYESQYYQANAGKMREKNRRYHERNRNAVLDHYGRACACCGSTERLAIDHINGGGREHRAQLGKGFAIDRWLIDRGFPDGFQTLCQPCNSSKGDGPACKLHP